MTTIRHLTDTTIGRILVAGLLIALTVGLSLVSPPVASDESRGAAPQVAIIIDDLGYQLRAGQRAAELPGNLTFAVIPNAPYARALSRLLDELNQETIIHLPMEPFGSLDPGPGAIHGGMSSRDVEQTVSDALARVPNALGLNNHMGSLATTNSRLMNALMSALANTRSRSLYFLDSRTSPRSIANVKAREHGVPHYVRDVFLDNTRRPSAIRAQLQRLVRKARQRGYALGIGHPYRETISVLQQELPRLRAQGIELVSVSQLRIPSEVTNDRSPNQSLTPVAAHIHR